MRSVVGWSSGLTCSTVPSYHSSSSSHHTRNFRPTQALRRASDHGAPSGSSCTVLGSGGAGGGGLDVCTPLREPRPLTFRAGPSCPFAQPALPPPLPPAARLRPPPLPSPFAAELGSGFSGSQTSGSPGVPPESPVGELGRVGGIGGTTSRGAKACLRAPRVSPLPSSGLPLGKECLGGSDLSAMRLEAGTDLVAETPPSFAGLGCPDLSGVGFVAMGGGATARARTTASSTLPAITTSCTATPVRSITTVRSSPARTRSACPVGIPSWSPISQIDSSSMSFSSVAYRSSPNARHCERESASVVKECLTASSPSPCALASHHT
mmetsp:Transcript_25026/g.63467  ORF Transcript_25026/g.63467 Transcript_25026/m.63467 type:complete len:323 (-) Transcript_25026:832-1800(-)